MAENKSERMPFLLQFSLLIKCLQLRNHFPFSIITNVLLNVLANLTPSYLPPRTNTSGTCKLAEIENAN